MWGGKIPKLVINAYTVRYIPWSSLLCDSKYFDVKIGGDGSHPTTITYTAKKACRILCIHVVNAGAPETEIMEMTAGQTISFTDTGTYYTYSYVTAFIV